MITREHKNIIIADDSGFFRVKLSDIITEAGHKVKVFSNGRKVINEIKANPDWAHLLILDILMPEMDGFGVLKWIKENGMENKFPVLVITGAYEPSHVLERIKELGARGMMTKAFTPEQIVFRVNKLLFPDKTTMRQGQRVPITIPVDFSVGNDASTGFLINISENGMFLHTERELLPGTYVNLRFSLPGSERVINTRGIVKWRNYAGEGKSIFSGAGVNFVSLGQDEQDMIREFVKRELDKMETNE
ncbi:MAG: hypothetical protein A2073_08645 [Deltaproteobacteria bacterium GWC2_42_11]|nr:MAG: hypothetical protein A2073_08645 [Deltaproteobacteria bacterium GWC2_42_11]HBO83552.1 hypothetical protein [Deltaproteobacteria bacterium]